MNPEYYYRNCTWKEMPEICMIELTNNCNFSCIMCSNKFMTRKKGFMTKETFQKTLDECEKAGIKQIKLYTTGESLLHPKFMEFWRLAITYPFKTIMISTNGSLLTEEMIDEFTKSEKFRIQFSFSGWDKKGYESKYVGGDFEKTKKTIHYIIDAIKKANLPKNTLTINGVTTGVTGGIKKTKDFLKKEFYLDENQLFIHNANNWIDVINQSQSKNQENKRYYCHISNIRIGVLYNGDVTACGCLDVNGELVIGNINDNTISEIRKGKKFKEFKDNLTKGELNNLMCKNCDSLKEIR